MRVVELGRIIAQAEGLRMRRLGRRQAMRAVFGVVAAIFAIALLVSLHVAGALALAGVVAAPYAALIVGGIDLVILAVFGILAARNAPDRIEAEAQEVSREARAQLAEAAVMSALILPVLRRAGFGMASRLLGGRRASGTPKLKAR